MLSGLRLDRDPALTVGASTPVSTLSGRLTGALLACAGGIALGVVVLLVALLASGHRLNVIVTGSMRPEIPVGGIVLSERTTVGSLKVGDVIAFPRPDDARLTMFHRIVKISPTGQGDAVQVHTKGDANTDEDPWVLAGEPAAPADRVTRAYPAIGGLAAPARMIAVLGFVACFVVGLSVAALRWIWRPSAA